MKFQLDVHHAAFDTFLWRDGGGKLIFLTQMPTVGRHRDRVWPALSRYKREWEPLRDVIYRGSHRHKREDRSIRRAARLTVLRRWDPMNPLEGWHTKQCDHAQRPPRYDPW